jgi:hypothetical protein
MKRRNLSVGKKTLSEPQMAQMEQMAQITLIKIKMPLISA